MMSERIKAFSSFTLKASLFIRGEGNGFFKEVKSATRVMLSARILKKQTRYVKEDIVRFQQDFPVANLLKKQFERCVDAWVNFIHQYGVQPFKNRHHGRRGVALRAMLIYWYYKLVRGHYSVGTAYFLMAELFFHNNFRLYQIRRCKLYTRSSKTIFYIPTFNSKAFEAMDRLQPFDSIQVGTQDES